MKKFLLILLLAVQLFAQDLQTKSIHIQNVQPSTIATIFGQPIVEVAGNTTNIYRAPNFNPMAMPNGIISCLAMDNLSILVVQSLSKEAIDQMEQLVKLFDVAPKQIEIQAQLITLTSSNMKNLNLQWGVSKYSTQISGILGTPGQETIDVRVASGNFWEAIKALRSDNHTKTITTQTLVVQNSLPGTISFAQQLPVWMNGGIIVQGNNLILNPPTVAFASVITSLNVVARANNDSVELVLSPQIQEVMGFTQGFGGQRVPMVTSFNLYTRVRLKNGEDLVIGGLNRNGQKTGWFNQIKENTESILVVRANILK